MIQVINITLKGIFRDKVFQGIMMLAVLFAFVPLAASLSMRQVVELSITLSLSLVSFILLVLAVFLGATSVWKDIERRNAYSVLSLPISRMSYMAGRFYGIALFMLFVSLVLGLVVAAVVGMSANMYPPARPIVWSYIALAILFNALRSILLVGVAMLFSTISTSFFLPVFGTITIFIIGGVTQQVYDFIHTQAGTGTLSPLVRHLASIIYYVVPNLSSFDLKVNAIYAINPTLNGILLTMLYFAVYTAIVLSAGVLLFERREIK
jgi:Cu-processing system permease protein